MQVFDSNGPDVRIRGTAHQVAEKYMALAKDAASSGDIVLSESYLQHAEHYQRIIGAWEADVRPESAQAQPAGNRQPESAQKPKGKSDDLSLPSSILGAPSKRASEEGVSERTAEVSAS